MLLVRRGEDILKDTLTPAGILKDLGRIKSKKQSIIVSNRLFRLSNSMMALGLGLLLIIYIVYCIFCIFNLFDFSPVYYIPFIQYTLLYTCTVSSTYLHRLLIDRKSVV